VILLFDPLAILSVGFWLSFSAVGIIIYCIAGRLAKSGYVWSMIKINWATSVALAPLVLWFFQQVSLISPIAYIVAVPIISLLVVPLSLLGILALFISPFLVEAVLYPVEQTLQAVCWFLTKLTAIPFAAINHPAPSLLALCFAVIGILLLLAPKGIPARWLGLVLFLPFDFANKKHLSRGEFALTLLDARQGLATVVETTEHVLGF
jgi:competence protein ComEC